MGCESSREHYIKEEALITDAEDSLGFSSCSADIVDLWIRKYSSDGTINPEQMKDIFQSCGISMKKPLESSKLLNCFRKKDNTYTFRPFLIFGILLSTDLRNKKSSLLFEVFDENYENSLKEATIHQLIDHMLNISINLLPLRILDQDLPDAKINKVLLYSKYLKSYQEIAKESLIRMLVRDEVKDDGTLTKVHFIESFDVGELHHLLTPHGIRMYVKKIAETTSKNVVLLNKRFIRQLSDSFFENGTEEN
mmetsp:Transcript_22671/g.22434  ORF Transcript_22671/g.22434 Transcript_22671/m.22434 type:complete len:251 (+) Transcript_22671:15-767(+)